MFDSGAPAALNCATQMALIVASVSAAGVPHWSALPGKLTALPRNSSLTLGPRIAFWYWPRNVMSLTGASSAPAAQVNTLPGAFE